MLYLMTCFNPIAFSDVCFVFCRLAVRFYKHIRDCSKTKDDRYFN
ncbi:hypothetical protein GCHA_2177 [Paraglaciecola chathamensis S18K6]|uniref:Uncharacterized protein n=1 Tax=Paraglaciecola chathamensis S18K6 TaxID=1127672 RepID=A0AAV3UZM2_9ALTE|nr:hypothetical protein GCHA_2177 [Paraglaciecola chathamensis S18K6]